MLLRKGAVLDQRGGERREPHRAEIGRRMDEMPRRRFRLRPASDDDGQALLTLVSTVWSEYPTKKFDFAKDGPSYEGIASRYRANNGDLWVVVDNDSNLLVGSIGVVPAETPGGMELQKLYVLSSARGHNLGRVLCNRVERFSRMAGAAFVDLWSDVVLTHAHRLYEDIGYIRGENTRAYADISGTVRYYYRKDIMESVQ